MRNVVRRAVGILFILCVIAFSFIVLVKRNEGGQGEAERGESTAGDVYNDPLFPIGSSRELEEKTLVKQFGLPADREKVIPEIAFLTKELNRPDTSVHEDLEIIDSLLGYYRTFPT